MPKNIMIIMAPTPATKQPWQQAPQNTATNDSCCLDNPCRELVETRSTTARPPIGFQSGNREGPARSCRGAVCPAFLLGRRPQGLQDTARAQAGGARNGGGDWSVLFASTRIWRALGSQRPSAKPKKREDLVGQPRI